MRFSVGAGCCTFFCLVLFLIIFETKLSYKEWEQGLLKQARRKEQEIERWAIAHSIAFVAADVAKLFRWRSYFYATSERVKPMSRICLLYCIYNFEDNYSLCSFLHFVHVSGLLL